MQRDPGAGGPVQRPGTGEDLPVRLTGARDWLVIAVIVVVALGGAVWGVTARLPRSVSADGLITSPGGAFTVQSPVGGAVMRVMVDPGDRVRTGTALAVVRRAGVDTTVPSPADGTVFAVPAHVGDVLNAGSAVIDAERSTADTQPVAVLFLPAVTPATVEVGATVRMSVLSAPAAQYGVLLGRITSVDPVLSTREQVAAFVGDAGLAGALGAAGGARRVVVHLDQAATPSGFRWSNGHGPPFPISARTVVVGSLPQPPERPLDWVVPG